MPEVDVIRAQLFALQDKEYQIFYSRLMPTLPPETVIGVRVPLLRKLAKQPAAALPWLTEKRLDVWTHNKTIQKAVESYRIPPEQKQTLRALRIRSQKLCEERRV